MASILSESSRLSRVQHTLPTPAVDFNKVRRVAASLGVINVDTIRVTMNPKADCAMVEMRDDSGATSATLEIRAGHTPVLRTGGALKDVRPKKQAAWSLLDAMLFGECVKDCNAAWLHQPFPPQVGEVPSLLLEALARIGGLASGMDGVLDEPIRLSGGFVSGQTLCGTVANGICVCSRVRIGPAFKGATVGDKYGGKALGATLEVKTNRIGVTELKAHCQHADGCNTIMLASVAPSIQPHLGRLHEAATKYAAVRDLSKLDAADAASAGRELLDELGRLPPPSKEAVDRVKSGSWEAWRSNRDTNKGTLVGWDTKAATTRTGKRKPPIELDEDHACLALRLYPDRKRAKVQTTSLDECFSAAGLKRAHEDLAALNAETASEKRRKTFVASYIDAVDASYGKPDADGLRWQHVQYGQRPDSHGRGVGRQNATNVCSMRPQDREPRSVCLPGMMRELRPYGLTGHARDLDFKMCQPLIFSQLVFKLTWADGRAPPALKEIHAFCADGGGGRDVLFKELAIHHKLDSDADCWPSYQRDILKKLTTSLFFGGYYTGWIRDTLLPPREGTNGETLDPARNPAHEPRHQRVKALERDMKDLRKAIFESNEWKDFVAEWSKLLHIEKGGDRDAIERSVMARIAQHLEDKCLRAMVAQLKEGGWQVLARIFDGCIVRDRPGRSIDISVLEERVRKDTGFQMIIEEKELFDAVPKLTLARSID